MTPTKLQIQRIQTAIEQVAKSKSQKKAVNELKEYFDKNTMVAGIKDTVVMQLTKVIEGKIEPDPTAVLMSLMTLTSAPELKFTAHQLECLKAICDIVKDAKEEYCEHKFVIAPFLHGGCFSPTFALPELICYECGLNVTIPRHLDNKALLEQYGIDVPDKLMKTLQEWAVFCLGDKDTQVISSGEISNNLKRALKESTQFVGDFSMMEVVDKRKLESMSGR